MEIVQPPPTRVLHPPGPVLILVLSWTALEAGRWGPSSSAHHCGHLIVSADISLWLSARHQCVCVMSSCLHRRPFFGPLMCWQSVCNANYFYVPLRTNFRVCPTYISVCCGEIEASVRFSGMWQGKRKCGKEGAYIENVFLFRLKALHFGTTQTQIAFLDSWNSIGLPCCQQS